MIKVTGDQQRCRRGCNDKGNWSVSRDVEEDVMIKVVSRDVEEDVMLLVSSRDVEEDVMINVTGQSAEM